MATREGLSNMKRGDLLDKRQEVRGSKKLIPFPTDFSFHLPTLFSLLVRGGSHLQGRPGRRVGLVWSRGGRRMGTRFQPADHL